MTPAKQSRKRSTSKPRAKAAPTFEVLETSPITSPKPAVTAAVSAEPNPWRLRKIHEVEEWQRFNPFILSGYRYRYTVAMCMRSLFMVHNETGNVWTHLIGFAIFVSLAWHVISSVIEVSVWHYTVFFFYMLTNMLCMGSSTVYHLMSCHSEWLMRATLFVDFFGISALITGSFIPPIFYVFTCYPWLRILYLSQITILGGATLVAPWFKFFNSEEWQTRRVLLYVVTIASGLAPTGHLLFLFPRTWSPRRCTWGSCLCSCSMASARSSTSRDFLRASTQANSTSGSTAISCGTSSCSRRRWCTSSRASGSTSGSAQGRANTSRWVKRANIRYSSRL
jgi:predicted membrane channel-forming protein YqfA (hemolysin III family)